MLEDKIQLTVEDGHRERLDAYVAARVSDMTRGAVQRLIEQGHLSVNGAAPKASYRVRSGDVIEFTIPEPTPSDIRPQEIPLDIVYEDEDIIVINKPKGMTTHPAPGSPEDTLVNAILAHSPDLSGVGGVQRPGIVHRLDKDTSGLLVVAKNDQAHVNLQHQIQERTAKRKYYALVWGQPKFEDAVVEAPIGRHPVDRKRQAVITDSHHTAREAITDLKVVERFQGAALLEASLRTGRTHQIRVHCAFIGLPVVGDPLYGPKRPPIPTHLSKKEQGELVSMIDSLDGQALHAYYLAFDHPRTGERLEFTAEVPKEMETLISWFREEAR
jgi:23S rRNA pseudouridine1911/1915/1917 synthase